MVQWCVKRKRVPHLICTEASLFSKVTTASIAKCCNMLYHIRDFVNAHALVMLYCSFVYSCLTYGITALGSAAQNQLCEIEVKLNNILRNISWNKKIYLVSQLYKKLRFLKLHDVYKLELAKFLHHL